MKKVTQTIKIRLLPGQMLSVTSTRIILVLAISLHLHVHVGICFVKHEDIHVVFGIGLFPHIADVLVK